MAEEQRPPESEREPEAGVPRRSRYATAAVIVAVVVSLLTTAQPVFDPGTQDFYADSPDSVRIADMAARVTLRDALGWWHGQWIQQTPYYRPLASWVIWAEYLVTGGSFAGLCAVSWLLHGLNGALLCLLALRLLGDRCPGWVWALLAVGLFNWRLGPAGPSWHPWPVAIGVVAWWPAQTDQLSLAAALSCLIFLDRYLAGRGRRDLIAAYVLYAAALLCKEMAVCVPLLAALLLVYRREKGQWQVPLAWAGMAAALLVIRRLAVPDAMNPALADFYPQKVARKLLWYSLERLWSYVDPGGAQEYWLVVAGWATMAAVYLLWRLRVSVVWMVLVGLLLPGIVAQGMEGNFALVTIPRELYGLCTVVMATLGVLTLVRLGTRQAWLLLGMVGAVHVPIIHVIGPHYWYWPAAFWGMFSACLVSLAGGRMAEVARKPPFAAGRPVEAQEDHAQAAREGPGAIGTGAEAPNGAPDRP